MRQQNGRVEFVALLLFLLGMGFLLSNGFAARINADTKQSDAYLEMEPIADVLDIIQREYVREAEIPQIVEGALSGMMSALDRHSSFVSTEDLMAMREDTKGEFEGIGVQIRPGDTGFIEVVMPLGGSPAAEAGIQPFDLIIKIDGVSTEGMTTAQAAEKIRGQRGTSVRLTILRKEGSKDDAKFKELELDVRRDKVALESIKEAGLLDGGIGYIRVSDFKETTARDIKQRLDNFMSQGMKAFILDLRWNPGGLLSASQEVCELFLPQNSLVTYTKGRPRENGAPNPDDMELKTSRRPVVPENLPIIILVNGQTASSSEIVTGALQFYQRAIIVGERTFGKGSVQTIIPLRRPENTALRITTALYYTPANVTIDHQGILPDVEVAITDEQLEALGKQMSESFKENPSNGKILNHGAITGYELKEGNINDPQLERAIQILQEDSVWQNLLKKYHKDVKETQVAAKENPDHGDPTKPPAGKKQPSADPETSSQPEVKIETQPDGSKVIRIDPNQ